MATAAAKTRSVLVRQRGADVMVENIPSNAKITFGPIQPGKQGGYREENVLRIYTTAGNQLAVFTGVEWFRDLSLTVKERKVNKKSENATEVGPDGKKSKSASEETYEWVEA